MNTATKVGSSVNTANLMKVGSTVNTVNLTKVGWNVDSAIEEMRQQFARLLHFPKLA